MQAMGSVSSYPRCPGKGCSGRCHHVETEEHGERLASYETDNYRADPCRINYIDGNEPVDDFGHVFKFVGNVRDLSDGTFDLGTWLRRVKRVPEDPSDVKQLKARKDMYHCPQRQEIRGIRSSTHHSTMLLNPALSLMLLSTSCRESYASKYCVLGKLCRS